MKKLLLGMCALLLLGGCARTYSDTTLYEKTGQMKPIVCVLPCVEKTNAIPIGWDLSTEITQEICRRVRDSSKVYFHPISEDVSSSVALLEPDPRKIPSAPLADLAPADFVVVTELIEQQQKTYGRECSNESKSYLNELGAVLSISMRLRVIDRRGALPKVVLQELVEVAHMVPKPYLNTDYEKVKWGMEPYLHTPLGMAHSKLLRDVVGHVEGYIQSAR